MNTKNIKRITKTIDMKTKEIIMNKEREVSPCCKADFEEAEGTACCNARLSETGLCYECREHAEIDGNWCLECDENFEEPITI
jgi:hypothetical protein